MNQNYSNVKTVRSSSTAPKAKKSVLPWVLGCFGAMGVLLIIAVAAYFLFFSSPQAPHSSIMIREPMPTSSLQMGEPVTIRAIASGDARITQVELWVNDLMIDYDTSDIPGGISPFPIFTSWYPAQTGMFTISARSTDINGKQSVNQITVNVLENADRDGDLIPDHLDQCPDQPGTDGGMGCMDTDFDGIPDEVDACREIAGLPDDGCPNPSENDRDGDGVIDERDACPDEAGTPLADGCLDRDGDGFADTEDPCPDEAGTLEGCPVTGDMDSDGIPDSEDACPTSFGTADMAGCADSDGDGILDHEDACPETAGSVDNNGCPAMSGGTVPPPPDPEDDDSESPGPSFGDMGFELRPPIPIEIRGNSFYMEDSYDSLWCYLTVFDSPPQRYDFDTQDGHYWNIEEVLGGSNSIHMMHNEDEPLNIRLSCMGETSSGEMVDALYLFLSRPPEDWNGQPLVAESDDHSFQLEYQICTPSCNGSGTPAPVLAPINGGVTGDGPYILHWRWNGNEDNIDEFIVNVFVNGERIGSYSVTPDTRSLNVSSSIPECDAEVSFEVYGYKHSPRVLTPKSNRETWTVEPCMYNAIVTFQSLDMHSPQNDEDGLPCMGPIQGVFSAGPANNEQSLSFNAAWINTFGTRTDGLWLCAGTHYITDIFNWVHREQSSCWGSTCHATDYSAPTSSSVHISLEEGEDIVVAAGISEWDTPIYSNPGERIFWDSQNIPFSDLSIGNPVRFVLEGEVANLIVVIQLQDAP